MTFLPWELTLIDRVPVLAALKASTMMRSNVAASCSEAGVDIYCTTRLPVRARGIGSLFLEAFFDRDIPVVQGCALCVAVFYVTVNLSVDLLYGVVDPRVRFV